LLDAGVRIFERTGDRTMHTKWAVFGENTSINGPWNADNRSASINSENLLVIYDEQIAQESALFMVDDMDPQVAQEVTLAKLNQASVLDNLGSAFAAMVSNLLLKI
jgi:phosphatidylserine/phosphatidylglycerophosphate/cardiolipin synthase-like enzyme